MVRVKLDERDFNVILADSKLSSIANRFVFEVAREGAENMIYNPIVQMIFNMSAHFGHVSMGVPIGRPQTNFRYDSQSRRWTGIPTKPKKAQELYQPLMNIINLLLNYSEEEIMMYFAPQDVERKRDKGGKLIKTDMVFVDYSIMGFVGGGIMTNETYLENWQQMVDASTNVVVEVSLDNDIDEGREWMMVYAKEYMSAVKNRQWCLCLLFTETTLEVYSLDRFGIYSTTVINYHDDPVQFAQAILAFSSVDRARASFDKAINFDSTGSIIATTYFTPETSEVEKRKKEKVKSDKVIATLFPTPETLQKIYVKASKSSYPLPLNQTVHIVPKFRGHPQKLWCNHTAGVRHPTQHPIPRTPMKVALMPLLKSIDKAPTAKDFKIIFFQTLKAHHKLYEAGILHGDITPKNIQFAGLKDAGAILMCELER